ncbi:damage-control phosphatase ARMT1 family protein [Desulfitobacterium sp.]|uniref:damage-control phosphatase ARMT1 family protein n=1 Tax=Desulfitobacterium sp. TaxID=49981 RepID=UPI002B92CD2A|nr:ARMT1-like domain-containing protein [Desulfitobacterium sp.]HVJ49891.1 ARMT1-like domain-containing protein [Desulfitobacterium sp.]
MKVVLECIPCYMKQVINTVAQTKCSEEKTRQIMYQILPMIPELDPVETPAVNSTLVLRKINELLEIPDPFKKAKRESNELALSLLPQLRKRIRESLDPFYTACQISVAGNIIDLGIITDYDIEETLRESLAKNFTRDDSAEFKERLRTAREVLILGDNSGEIAFDKLLAEELRKSGVRVTFVVKGQSILNDATLEDALQVGIDEVAEVITNGNGYLGTVVQERSKELIEAMERADLIISKGQANYESLESTPEAGKKTYFLLRAKCEIVAKNLGVDLGSMVFARVKMN